MKWTDKLLAGLLAGAARPPGTDDEHPPLGLEAGVMADWRSRDDGAVDFLRPFRIMLAAACSLMLITVAAGYYHAVTESPHFGLALANSAIESTIGQ